MWKFQFIQGKQAIIGAKTKHLYLHIQTNNIYIQGKRYNSCKCTRAQSVFCLFKNYNKIVWKFFISCWQKQKNLKTWKPLHRKKKKIQQIAKRTFWNLCWSESVDNALHKAPSFQVSRNQFIWNLTAISNNSSEHTESHVKKVDF